MGRSIWAVLQQASHHSRHQYTLQKSCCILHLYYNNVISHVSANASLVTFFDPTYLVGKAAAINISRQGSSERPSQLTRAMLVRPRIDDHQLDRINPSRRGGQTDIWTPWVFRTKLAVLQSLATKTGSKQSRPASYLPWHNL